MVNYEIISTDYLTNELGQQIKTVFQVKFIRDDGVESAVQRYEVDGTDEVYAQEQLQLSTDEYNLRKI